MRHGTSLILLAPLAATLALAAGPPAEAMPAPASELRQVGRTAVVYRGPALDLALSYRYAKASPGEPWLLLDVAMTAAHGTVEVRRDQVAIVTPTGETVPLATQDRFAIAFPRLIGAIGRANVAAEPLDYFTPHRPRRLQLFTAPGRAVVFPSAWLDEWHTSFGRLYFELPDPVKPGSYALLIHLKQGEVRIPFQL